MELAHSEKGKNRMPWFKVTMTRTIREVYDVEAKDSEVAREKAMNFEHEGEPVEIDNVDWDVENVEEQ